MSQECPQSSVKGQAVIALALVAILVAVAPRRTSAAVDDGLEVFRHRREVLAIAGFSGSGRRLVISVTGGEVYLCDADKRHTPARIRDVSDGALAASGERVATVHVVRRELFVWNIDDGKRVHRASWEATEPQHHIAVSADGTAVAMVGTNEVRLHRVGDALKGPPPVLWIAADKDRPKQNIAFAAFSPDGALMAIARREERRPPRELSVVDVKTGRQLYRLDESVEGFRFTPDSLEIITLRGGSRYQFMVWNAADGEYKRQSRDLAPHGAMNGLVFDHAANRVFFGTSATPERTSETPLATLGWTQIGGVIMTRKLVQRTTTPGTPGTLEMVTLDKEAPRTLENFMPESLCASADGRRMAVANFDGEVHVWSLDGEPKKLGTYKGNGLAVLSHDGSRLATLRGENAVVVYTLP
jgi:hypothetical protein